MFARRLLVPTVITSALSIQNLSHGGTQKLIPDVINGMDTRFAQGFVPKFFKNIASIGAGDQLVVCPTLG